MQDTDAERFTLYITAIVILIVAAILEIQPVITVLAQFVAYFSIRLKAMLLMAALLVDIAEAIERKDRERVFFSIVS